MSTVIDTLKDGTLLCGTDILATEIAKMPQGANVLQKDGQGIANADKAINAIYQFITDCGYIAKFDNHIYIDDDNTLNRAIRLRIYDSDNMDSYGFSLFIALYENAYSGMMVKFRDMYDHFVETSNNSRGYTTNTRKHPLTFLTTKFGASKVCRSEYVWTLDKFIENVPALTKYFKRSNTLGKYKAPNEEIIRNCMKSQRKMEIQKTKINGFINELEGFIDNIAPGLHVFAKEINSDPKTTTWNVSVFNSNLALWSSNCYWNSPNNGRAMLEEIFSDQNVYSDSISYQLDSTNISEMKEKIASWITECTDEAAKIEYTKILEDEAKKPLSTIDGIYSANVDYITNYTYNGEYSSVRLHHCTPIVFTITYSTVDDSWQILYKGVYSFPKPFRMFLDKANRVSKNPAELINYVELVYKTSLKANDYANKVIALTKAAEEDLKV